MTKAEREHMAKVKLQPCIICGCGPVDVHHAGTGMGGRKNHMKVLPLCQFHHTGVKGIHKIGRRNWQELYGTETELLAKLGGML